MQFKNCRIGQKCHQLHSRHSDLLLPTEATGFLISRLRNSYQNSEGCGQPFLKLNSAYFLPNLIIGLVSSGPDSICTTQTRRLESPVSALRVFSHLLSFTGDQALEALDGIYFHDIIFPPPEVGLGPLPRSGLRPPPHGQMKPCSCVLPPDPDLTCTASHGAQGTLGLSRTRLAFRFDFCLLPGFVLPFPACTLYFWKTIPKSIF